MALVQSVKNIRDRFGASSAVDDGSHARELDALGRWKLKAFPGDFSYDFSVGSLEYAAQIGRDRGRGGRERLKNLRAHLFPSSDLSPHTQLTSV